MSTCTEPLIFDGHNDVLSRLYRAGGLSACEGFLSGQAGHIDILKARQGGLGGGFFAVYVPGPANGSDAARLQAMQQSEYDFPLPDPVARADALPVALEQVALLHRLEALGALTICTSAGQIRQTLGSGQLAALLHMEGAEAIDPDFHALDVLYRAGLRSLGPVWSRATIFGHGVPFRYPSTGDIGPGLTPEGIALVHACNERGILIDLSHLNEAGFLDVATHSSHPLVATHSNCHAHCASSRNLTDAQLARIAESDGLVGVNFGVAFLRPDGQKRGDVDLEVVLRHLDYLIEHLGDTRVAFGSDFDGTLVPDVMGDAAGLTKLRMALRNHGYNDALMVRLCHGNWLRVLEQTLGG